MEIATRGWTETNPFTGPAWSLQYEYLGNVAYAFVLRRLKTWMLAALTLVAAAFTVHLLFWGDVPCKYTVIGGWAFALGKWTQVKIGFIRLAYPFLAGLLLARFKARIQVAAGGFVLCSVLVLTILIAWASFRLYDLPIRQWLSRKR